MHFAEDKHQKAHLQDGKPSEMIYHNNNQREGIMQIPSRWLL